MCNISVSPLPVPHVWLVLHLSKVTLSQWSGCLPPQTRHVTFPLGFDKNSPIPISTGGLVLKLSQGEKPEHCPECAPPCVCVRGAPAKGLAPVTQYLHRSPINHTVLIRLSTTDWSHFTGLAIRIIAFLCIALFLVDSFVFTATSSHEVKRLVRPPVSRHQ